MSTPLINYPKISSHLGIDLRVKHDDLYPFTGGGSKARKIKSIFTDAMKMKANAVVTAGAANSNHARVTAVAAANIGWKCIVIVHDLEDYSKGNLLLMKLAGAELRFVTKPEVARAMDAAMEDLNKAGYNPYYIWGGGHSIHGMMAYRASVSEFIKQANGWKPDFVLHASGTGGTQAGLHFGFKEFFPSTQVIGISVARSKGRGEAAVKSAVNELCIHIKNVDYSSVLDSVIFKDDWLCGGYGKVCDELMETIAFASRTEGLITDPTYTGKALMVLFDMRKRNKIKDGQKVLFWHTGGLINLFGHYGDFNI